ncbi:hypothetical protein CY35_19G055100 [Sphagnum magellanicum]|jgi:hypothetical protein|nr:hypothetical protein CY35_19G055100 [Sphagnum magellanicum]
MATNSYSYLNTAAAVLPLYNFALVLFVLLAGPNIGFCRGRELISKLDHDQLISVENNLLPDPTAPQLIRTDEESSQLGPAAASAYPAKYSYIHRKLRASTPLCSVADLSITQGLSGYNNGIPAYTVQIVNLCLNPRCEVSNIHVACEAFSSARPLDDLVFQRLSYNDCSVMNGAALAAGDSVAFEYANSSEYPMHIISAEVGPCTP